jgi:hypothetical protein
LPSKHYNENDLINAEAILWIAVKCHVHVILRYKMNSMAETRTFLSVKYQNQYKHLFIAKWHNHTYNWDSWKHPAFSYCKLKK